MNTRADVERFATAWAAAWNALDLEAVLAHFHSDARFTSAKAFATVGVATVEGRAALTAYWSARKAAIESLHFEVDRVIWDAPAREAVILYTATINGVSNRAAERFRFGADGLVIEGEALSGAAL